MATVDVLLIQRDEEQNQFNQIQAYDVFAADVLRGRIAQRTTGSFGFSERWDNQTLGRTERFSVKWEACPANDPDGWWEFGSRKAAIQHVLGKNDLLGRVRKA